jgi:D-beta-D-heptose 7-phosphate kinase/D-beta-D-heptose 1-phosphate adenosyltransferase
MKILVIGESCRDVFIYGECNRLCPEAPVPVFNPTGLIENGGMARNVYKNILSLNQEANLFTNESWKGITKTRYIDYNMNHMFMRVDEGDKEYGRANLKKLRYKNYDAIIISDYNKGFLSERDIEHISNKHDCVFLDTKKILGSWCRNIKYIKINNSEYKRTKHTISEDIIDKLIITMSREGCSHQNIIYPVPEVEIKDSSGAGDTFISALVVKYVETQNIEKSIKFANECATTVVQKRGVSTI